jgi:uncharacterized protein
VSPTDGASESCHGDGVEGIGAAKLVVVTRTLPMFPLGTVLLPFQVLPLHVFEPRYQALVRTCLSGEPEFGVTLIERGSEVGGGDMRAGVGCLARIVDVKQFPDGRLALVAVGTTRLEVIEWLADDPYPQAMIAELDEGPPATQ